MPLNSELDRAIDDAARRMTAGAPGADLRAQVMARLADDDDAAPRGVSRWRWAPAALVVAAAIVIAVSLGRSPRRGEPVTPGGSQPDVLAARTMAPAGVMPSGDSPIVEREAASARRADLAPSATAALAPAALAVPSLALDAVPDGESIRIPELEPVAPISLAPLGGPQGERR